MPKQLKALLVGESVHREGPAAVAKGGDKDVREWVAAHPDSVGYVDEKAELRPARRQQEYEVAFDTTF